MYLSTHLLDPNRERLANSFDQALQPLLPADYIRFLREYGPGIYTGEVNINYPDPALIPTTFGEYLDLWDFDETYTAADLLQSTQLASTADGNILCVAPNRTGRVFVLPRHSEQVRSYASFFEAVDALLPAGERYFDPAFAAVVEQISLVKDGGLLDISRLHQLFGEQFQADFTANATTQPQYFFQEFGGWISFDLVYRNAITVKYQQPVAALVQPVLELLRQQIA